MSRVSVADSRPRPAPRQTRKNCRSCWHRRPAPEKHTTACAGCRAAAENIIEARALLRGSALLRRHGRAMVCSASHGRHRCAQSRTQPRRDTWTFLPKLAARLSWASAVALLLASGWLYQKPVATSTKPVLTDITGEPVVDTVTPANNDEVLVSLAERPR